VGLIGFAYSAYLMSGNHQFVLLTKSCWWFGIMLMTLLQGFGLHYVLSYLLLFGA
jgi:hypothetical protein